jgi:fructokinase
MKQYKMICFGEVLWDMLPTGKMPGGAPMNVGFHLNNFDFQTSIISRIGTDDLGNEILSFMNKSGLNTEFVQRGQTHLTGVVKVNLDDSNEVSYKIVQPVAWDYIKVDPKVLDSVKKCDAFVFGTLAARSEETLHTLKEYLKIAPFKVLDVNLRPPYYNQETLSYLLDKADVVKMNHHELEEISAWYFEATSTNQRIEMLSKTFDIPTICVTLGADGALLFTKGKFTQCSGIPVEVVDTIGSGDSFLAALIKGLIQKQDETECLNFACATGAYVATQKGATPIISETQIKAWVKP